MSFSFEQEINGKLPFLDGEGTVYQSGRLPLVACMPIFIVFANVIQSWYDIHYSLPMF